jgi:DNA-binding Xre family transcriptional regulator
MAKQKRTIRKPTDADKKKLAVAIAEERASMEANREVGRELQKKRAVDTAVANALRAAGALRVELGISLRQLEAKTGITAGNLSRMWNDPDPNVTVKTLERLAAAMGRTVRIEFDKVEPNQKR